jgi:putative ribosome biogenesis GTPase RsgA
MPSTPRDHEEVSVVGDEHHRHRREKGVILKQTSRATSLARAEVAGRKNEIAVAAAPRIEKMPRGISRK